MSEWKRLYARGLYGTIGDRWAEGHGAICVVGDLLQDIDEFYRIVKTRDGYPCLELERREVRPGGAGAVAAMVESLGVKCFLVCDRERVSVKQRIIVDQYSFQRDHPRYRANWEVVCRIDDDKPGQPPKDIPPAEIYLIADYAKGAVDAGIIAACHRFPKHQHNKIGREVIADWHPSQPREFYGPATIKSSWCSADIETAGKGGLIYEGRRYGLVHPENLTVVDPCGAGDMVLATLGVCRLKGLHWAEACHRAAENAAKVCERWGAAWEGSEV